MSCYYFTLINIHHVVSTLQSVGAMLPYLGTPLLSDVFPINRSCAYGNRHQVPPQSGPLSLPILLACLLIFSDGTMEGKKDKVKWSQANDAMLLQTLTAKKSEGHWGDNNPKPPVWAECTRALAGSEKRSGGIAKRADAIKSRWQKVFHIFSYCALLY